MEYKLMQKEVDKEKLKEVSRALQLFCTSSFRQQGQFFCYITSMNKKVNVAFRFTFYAINDLYKEKKSLYISSIMEKIKQNYKEYYERVLYVVNNSPCVYDGFKQGMLDFLIENKNNLVDMKPRTYYLVRTKLQDGHFITTKFVPPIDGWATRLMYLTDDGKRVLYYLDAGFLF